MTRLPFPGILTEQERINLESIETKPVQNFIYFTLTAKESKNSKLIGVVKRNSIIYPPILVRVIDPWDADPDLVIGTSEDERSIAILTIATTGTSGLFSSQLRGLLTVYTVDTQIRVGIDRRRALFVQPTTGSITGIITWLDMSQVEGF